MLISIESFLKSLYFSQSANTYQIRTPDSGYTFSNSLVMRNPYLFFRVKACSEIYVQLMSQAAAQDSVSYYFRYGFDGNSGVELYKTGEGKVAEGSTEHLLTCESLKMYYVWVEEQDDGNAVYHTGIGDSLGADNIISYTDTDPLRITAVNLASSHASHTNDIADWQFRGDARK